MSVIIKYEKLEHRYIEIKKKIWELEQKINFGIKNERISKKDLGKYVHVLKIDKDKRKFIEYILK